VAGRGCTPHTDDRKERLARDPPPTFMYLSVLAAPLIPLMCLALVLWLDRLEESLDSAAKLSAPQAPAQEEGGAGSH
jgi:hypothetical protein